MHGVEMIDRHATDEVIRHLTTFRVVVMTGARQVGKSTLARLVLDRTAGRYLTLDDPLVFDRAVSDPDGLVAAHDGLTVIDEVQRAPDLLRAIKLVVDRDPTPGRFLLTGSANLLTMRSVVESLAGRAIYVELLPLTWSELRGRPRPATLDHAFTAKDAEELGTLVTDNVAVEMTGGACERALSGGMPEACRLAPDQRRVWYDSYRRTFLERDLRQLSQIHAVPEFSRLTSLALLRSAGLLNRSSLAVDARVSHSTADRYLDLLQVAYQIRLLQPFFSNLSKRHVKSPKLYAVDCAAAAWAANVWDWRAAQAGGRDGALLETFAVNDILAWDGLGGLSRYSFWRTGGGSVVDLVVERGPDVVAVEVKSRATLTYASTSGLRALRTDLGARFRMGVIAHLGERVQVIDDSIVAIPMASFLGAA